MARRGSHRLSFTLLPGKHKLIAKLSKHETETKDIVLANEPKTRVHFALTPSSEFSDVKFMVSERGVDVMVNRKLIGKSPIVGKKRLKRGTHDVVAIKPGFKNWTGTISVKEAEKPSGHSACA